MLQAGSQEGFVRSAHGLRLYYRIDGDVGRVLLCSNGIGVPHSFWEPFAARMAREYRVVRWDYRGHGRSDSPRDPRDVSIARCADDLAALMDGLGLESAVLLGHSMGAQLGFEYYRREPRRVAALIPTLGTYRHGVETLMNTRASLVALAVARHLVGAAPMLVSRAARPLLSSAVTERLARLVGIVDPALAPPDLVVRYLEHLVRMDLRTYVALAEDMQRHDASAVLPAVEVPVLVVAAERDRFVPVRLAREMAALIPGSELLVIPNGTHAALIEQPELLCLRVDKFLRERVGPAERPAAPVRELPRAEAKGVDKAAE